MFTFTFIQQAIIVYVYLCSNFKKSLCQTPNINIQHTHARTHANMHARTYSQHTHKHNCFMALLDFLRDYPG